ncbi:hypothetical protein DXD48_08075, partial [Collinsella sp. TM05-37]|uniref:hypothetical protein n=1 Tax=Collinsella sp. TM05-37 TaxID=2292340 RepID=UPI000E8AA436
SAMRLSICERNYASPLVFLKANMLQRQFKEVAVMQANANRRNKWADRIERCLSSNMSAED